MVYANSFHRLVLLGTAFGDIWNTSLSIAADNGTDLEAVDTPLLDAVAAAVRAWYIGTSTTNGLRASQRHVLTGIKLNRINPAGRYEDDTTFEHTYTSPAAGGALIAVIPQAATVLSLLTDAERGAANRGRMYLPPCAGFEGNTGSTGQAAIADAQRVAQAGSLLIDAINDVYNSTFPTWSVGEVVVASNTGTGRFRRVTRVGVGRVTDVMRSRRSALVEAPEIVDVPA